MAEPRIIVVDETSPWARLRGEGWTLAYWPAREHRPRPIAILDIDQGDVRVSLDCPADELVGRWRALRTVVQSGPTADELRDAIDRCRAALEAHRAEQEEVDGG